MSFKKNKEKTHFTQWESNVLNIELIIKTLFDEQILKPSFKAYDWRSNINLIVSNLKEYLNWLKEDDYKIIKLSILIKKPILDYSKDINRRNYSTILLRNWINNKYKDLINDIISFNNIKFYLENEIINTLNSSLYLKDLKINLDFEYYKQVDVLYEEINEKYRFFERLNNFMRHEWDRFFFIKNLYYNKDEFIKNKITQSFSSVLKNIREFINQDNIDIIDNDELSHFLKHLEESFYMFDKNNRHNRKGKNIEKINKSNYLTIIDSYIEKLNNLINTLNNDLWKIKNLDFYSKIKENKIIQFNISARDFIPAFISRIEIFWKDTEKNEFIKKFSDKKNWKMWLSILFLIISISLFSFVIIENWKLYQEKSGLFNECKIIDEKNEELCNTIYLTPSEFFSEFISKNIYLFSIQLLSLILAFYFLWLFKTYRKVVELYDSHILLIESDFYYKNDQDLITWDEKSFELRKENTQKIHNLPEKTFSILHWKESIKQSLPSNQFLDKLWELIEIITQKIK